jgi:TonB-linked SusC/RagA family outer membrane protein
MTLSAQRWRAARLLSQVSYALFLAMAALSSAGQSPDVLKTTINIKADQRPLEKVLKEIASLANVKFAYDINEIKKYTVTLREKRQFTLEDVLKTILQQTGLAYESHAHTIVIFDREDGKSAGDSDGRYVNYKTAKKNVIITGTITDENGPLQHVSIAIKGMSGGLTTDENGNFRIETAGNEVTVIISFIGYQTKELVLRAGVPHIIRLERSEQQMDKAVVIGYGTQKTSKLTGAITQVQLDKITSRSVNSIGDVLQGKAPGVIVTQEGGDPTSTPSIYIRGLGGINGESALYVVDGSIVTGTPTINPNEIESISVLKDASATIYGARASGGVILITTKRGMKNESTVSLDAKFGEQSAWRKLQPLNAKQFADAINLADANAIPQVPSQNAFNASIYPAGQITRTNWMNDIFQHGAIQDYTAGISGGNDKSNYYMGFGYRRQDGILLNTYSQRFTFRMNSDRMVKSWLKVGENMSYSTTNGNGANTQDAYGGDILNAIFYPPSVAPYDSAGAYAGLPAQYAGSYGDVINPVADLKRRQVSNPVGTLTLNPYAEITPFPGLVFRSNFSYTATNIYSKSFQDKVLEIGKIENFNQLTQEPQVSSDLLAEQTLSYTKTFGGVHHLSLLGGYTFQDYKNDFLYVVVQGFNDQSSQYQYVQNGSNILTGGNNTQSGETESALISEIARINYDYQDKYLVSLIGRRDGSSLVASQNRFKDYGSVSAGWVLSKEAFLQPVDWLSNLKLRASYGILGNLGSLPVTAVNAPLAQTINYNGNPATETTGYAATLLANPSLDWASSKQVDLGLDISVLKNRLALVADYFVKNTENMLLQVATPPTTGVSGGQWQNGGDDQDKGIELGLTYNGPARSAFQYSVNANVSSVRDKLISLPGGQTNLPTNGYVNVRTILDPLYIHTGAPLYSYYVIRTDGIFQNQQQINSYTGKNGQLIQPNARPGDLKFVDVNGDGKIDNNDRVVETGAFPKFTYGFSFNATYKNFDLNIFAQGVYGNKLFNSLKYLVLNASTGQNYNMLSGVLNAWSPTNTKASIPILSASDNNGNFGNTSDWYLENGSYLRIKNITLGYTFPDLIARRVGLSKVRIYVTSNNFLTFTKYSGFDPEVGMNNYGVDFGRYPQARSFMAGLNVNF